MAPQGICIAFDDATLEPNPTWTALTNAVSFEITRGRSYELDTTQTGTATVSLIDSTGILDPTNPGSAYYGKLDPLKQAAIAIQNPVDSTWNTLFRGFVDDWDYDMDVSGNFSRITLSLVDGFDLLSAVEAVPDNAGDLVPTESVGDVFYEDGAVDDRIRAALADAGWPSALSTIFTGNVNVQETIYPPRSPLLAVMRDAADAEFPGVANIYMSKDGKVTFHGRLARFDPTNPDYDITTWDAGGMDEVTVDPTKAVISGLTFNRGKNLIYNAALATPQNINDKDIAGQFVSDSSSISVLGPRTISFENLLTKNHQVTLVSANDETKLYATYYVDNYKNPRTRVKTIRFRSQLPSTTTGAATWNLMCGIEIGDIVALTTTHVGGGGFNESFYVEGLHYTAAPLNASYHDVTLDVDVSPAAYYDTNPF